MLFYTHNDINQYATDCQMTDIYTIKSNLTVPATESFRIQFGFVFVTFYFDCNNINEFVYIENEIVKFKEELPHK